MRLRLKYWFLDRPHVIRRIGEARAKVLRSIGAKVMRASRAEVKRKSSPSRLMRQVGTMQVPGGPSWQRPLPLMELRKRRPAASGVTSHTGIRSPKGFLKSSIVFDYDYSTNSVVIGPRKMGSYSPRLYQLHEEGGGATQQMYLRYRGRPVPHQVARGLRRTGNRSNYVYVGSFFDTPPNPSRTSWRRTNMRRQVNVRKGQYQRKALRKMLPKIPAEWRNKIRGP